MKRPTPSLGTALGLLAALPCAVALAQTVNIPTNNVLPLSAADTNKPGFIWNIAQVTAISPSRLSDAETIIAGGGGANIVDPNAIGTASGVGMATSPDPSAPISFNIPAVINFSKAAPDSIHNRPDLPPEDAFSGVPGTTSSYDNMAAEALAWIALPAGQTKIGVRSDDGFRLVIGGATPSDHFSPNATVVVQHDGNRSASDNIVTLNVSQAGLYAARVLYYNGGGNASVEFYTFVSTNAVLVNDKANGGIAAYRAVTTPARSYLSSLQPSSGATGISPNPTIIAKIVNGVAPVSSITLAVDGTNVTPSITTTASGATVSYSVPGFFNPLTTHSASLSWNDNGTPQNVTWSFTIAGYQVLAAAQAVSPDLTKPGFKFNIFANSSESDNPTGGGNGDNPFCDYAERGLNGLATDSSGTVLANFADRTAVGASTGAAPALAGPNAPAQFQIAGTINLGGTNMPGWPATDGTTDPSHSEMLTYVQLPVGLTTFVVTLDGHYRAFLGSWDYTANQQAGSSDAPGSVTAQFFVTAPVAGYYPLRVTYYNVDGTPGISIATLVGGVPVLLNDTGHGGLAAYRATTATAGPYIRYTSPRPVPRQLFLPSHSVFLRIQDRDTQLDDTSPALTLDGHATPLTTNRIGDVLELTFTPTNLQTVAEIHSATLTYRDKAAHATTNQWSFMNLKSIWLPATPVDIETFESYTEGTVFSNSPAGNNWYVWNFDAPSGNPTFDITDANSDAYLNFVVVGATTFANIEGDSANVAPFEMSNGVPITVLEQGNILAAESDNRADTYPGQVQFAVSRRFNLSTVTNAVVAWSSLYKQNQNSFGAIEYSVDGQKSWMPVIYYLDGKFGFGGDPADLLVNFDGTANPVLSLAGADAPSWFNTNGVYQSTYGAGVAAPISSALSPFFAPRIDDDGTSGKRLEVVRLPLAGGKSDVRLRFCQLGLCSWYFAVDNIAFYDIPLSGATVPVGVPTILSISQSAGSVTVKWTGGTLQSATDLSNPSWQTINNSTGTYTEVIAGKKFFRVSAQ
jgi:hypothetical protein